ncbi:hypothetical protein DFJ74DRAFT_237857 [Hyaloraphidium curvatum]|nr:hypothetical protein DFJ74DRAFT_237857 [Hyaloraphidium curvatum]
MPKAILLSKPLGLRGAAPPRRCRHQRCQGTGPGCTKEAARSALRRGVWGRSRGRGGGFRQRHYSWRRSAGRRWEGGQRGRLKQSHRGGRPGEAWGAGAAGCGGVRLSGARGRPAQTWRRPPSAVAPDQPAHIRAHIRAPLPAAMWVGPARVAIDSTTRRLEFTGPQPLSSTPDGSGWRAHVHRTIVASWHGRRLKKTVLLAFPPGGFASFCLLVAE